MDENAHDNSLYFLLSFKIEKKNQFKLFLISRLSL